MRSGARDQEWKPARKAERPGEVTLSDLAVQRFGRLPLLMGDERPGIVHRLDRETSGIMIVTKTGDAMEALREAFRERRVEKAYLALVFGDPDFDQVELDWDLTDGGDDRRGWRDAGHGDQDARTSVEVVERYGAVALVLCHPTTGRRHQIRVHLFAAGYPIVGDKLYCERGGPQLPHGAPGVRRHLLHAAGLSFAHPVTGEAFEAEAPMAEDMAAVVDWFEG